MTATARRRSSPFYPTPPPMAAMPSSGSILMRPRFSSRGNVHSRSSAPCAFPSWTFRLSPSAKAPAKRSFATLDRLAQGGKVDRALADALGRAVAALHGAAGAVEAEPWIAALAAYIEQNDAAFRERPDLFPPAEGEALTQRSRAAQARIRPLFVERGHRGLIRHLHGDLHLGNIVLLGGRPVPFDAIEFSPLIASGDVLYDLAFLLMDLVERGFKPAANVVFNRYLVETKRTEDLDALASLPLFLSLRAAIRAKVTAARLEHAASDQRAAIAHSARAYFDFARRFIEPKSPRLIAIGGLSGTGKSALAHALAPELAPDPGAVVLRSDVERKTLFGKDETERLPQDAYAPASTPISTPASLVSPRGAAMPPMPMPPSPAARRSTIWVRSTGPASMPPARRRRPSSAYAR